MTEYRRSKRRRAADVIEVFDTMTEQAVGRIGNISESGMMLMTNHKLYDDALYQLRFTLDNNGRRPQAIEIGAHHLWSDGANVPGQFWAGLRFIDMSPEDAAHLRAWIEQPGGQFV
jgi:hypothetical protein